MKNDNIFPLERNNYFFGKLMTEREFNTEQSYFNNKRRLLNCGILSSGVLLGFCVTKIDGETIAVESGLAIDGLGRELALSQMVVARLSELNGFSDDRGVSPHVYLCAEYSETSVEPVPSMGGGVYDTHFSYVKENVCLFLRYGEPEPFEATRQSAEDSRAESLEKRLERGAREQLYLAKIHLIRWEEAYEIDKIENLPFKQYAEMFALPVSPQNINEDERRQEAAFEACQDKTEPSPPSPNSAFGTAEIKIPDNAAQGSVYYSEKITHGLGLVPVAVTLGLSVSGGAVFGDETVFGEPDDFSYAAKTFDDCGTFQIGVRVLASQADSQVLRFVWSAHADNARLAAEAAEAPRIVIKPSVVRIKAGEALRLTAEARGMKDAEITWSVREENGGDVTKSGVYTAPGDSGVYTVVASGGGVSGTVLIVVR